MSIKTVLFVDYYSFIGGGQVNLLSVFKAMDRRRYRPVLVLPSQGPFADRARRLDVAVFITPMGKARWRRFWEARSAFFRLKDLMREQKADIVHANCYPALKLAGPAARKLGIPVVWHKQIAVTQKPGSTTGRLWKFYSRYADRVIAVSKQGYQGLKALGIPEAKLSLLYNNADTARLGKAKALALAALKRLGVPAGRPIVLAAGMRRHHKGFDVFLRAAAKVKSKAHFVLLGDATPSEPAHEALLHELALAPALKGRLSVLPAQPDLGPWFKRAALFVSSSRWEGSPLVVIEAMAAGSAIVATRQGCGEILEEGKTGWLVEADDAAALAGRIEAALKFPKVRKTYAKAAQVQARKRFSLKAYVKDLMALYDGL